MSAYVLSYDFTTSSSIQIQLSAFVKSNRHITQWAHPFIGCFILKSDSGLLALVQSFDEFFGGNTLHVIAPLVAEQVGGILPLYLWEWVNQPQANALSGLLGQYRDDPAS